MISIERSKSGHPVLKVDGRYLASSFDPLKEANEWARRAAEAAGDAESVFVLGLGSGYHVEALRALLGTKPVLALECDTAIAKEAASLGPSLTAMPFLVEPEWHRLIEHASFRDLLAGRYSIAKHGPSCQLHPEYYSNVERLLIGREKIGFLLQLKTRPDLYALFDPKAIEAMGPELVSVKTLQKLFSGSAGLSRERRIWKVLEELIA